MFARITVKQKKKDDFTKGADLMDKEKLILVLESLANRNIEAGCANRFLFNDETKAINETVDLLKEQEATMVIESENMYTGLPITHCPKCGVTLDRFLYGRQHEGQINYCPMCGQAIEWE